MAWDGFGLGLAAKAATAVVPFKGGGGSCGPPYTESQDHEFEPDSGMGPGGVDLSHYCKQCGVVGTMHGGGAGAAGGGVDGPPSGGGWGDARGGGGWGAAGGGWGR